MLHTIVIQNEKKDNNIKVTNKNTNATIKEDIMIKINDQIINTEELIEEIKRKIEVCEDKIEIETLKNTHGKLESSLTNLNSAKFGLYLSSH